MPSWTSGLGPGTNAGVIIIGKEMDRGMPCRTFEPDPGTNAGVTTLVGSGMDRGGNMPS